MNLYVNQSDRGRYVATAPLSMAKVSVSGQAGKKPAKDADENVTVQADSLMIRRKQAQKQAMKLMKDAYAFDEEMNRTIDEQKEQIAALRQDNLANLDKIAAVGSRRQRMMEDYGVSEDSQEFRDLELLRKKREATGLWSDVTLTKEEEGRLMELEQEGLTEFQSGMLSLDSEEELYRTYIDKNTVDAEMISLTVGEMIKEKLKQNPMVKAAKQADDIMDAVNQEILGELFADGKERLDEAREEEKERAEEKKEQEEEQEKIKEAHEEREEEQKELIQGIQENALDEIELAQINKGADPVEAMTDDLLDEQARSLHQRMNEIVKKLKLLEDDLKGAAVDFSL